MMEEGFSDTCDCKSSIKFYPSSFQYPECVLVPRVNFALQDLRSRSFRRGNRGGPAKRAAKGPGKTQEKDTHPYPKQCSRGSGF